MTPTRDDNQDDGLWRTSEKVKRREIESPQELANLTGELSDTDCGRFDESSDECY